MSEEDPPTRDPRTEVALATVKALRHLIEELVASGSVDADRLASRIETSRERTVNDRGNDSLQASVLSMFIAAAREKPGVTE